MVLNPVVCGYGKKSIVSLGTTLTFSFPGVTLLEGSNGGGKTTFLKTVAGILRPIHGEAVPCSAIYLPERLDFHGDLAPETILGAFTNKLNPHQTKRSSELISVSGLDIKAPFRNLSKGNRQKLALCVCEAMALASTRPTLLLLDEPLSGFDVASRDAVYRYWESESEQIHRIISLHSEQKPLHQQRLLIQKGMLSLVA